MTALLRTEELRRLEEMPRYGVSLMALAGKAAAAHAARLARDTGAPILVVAGPGHNGGDAWVAAAHLQEAFYRVTVVDLGADKASDDQALAAKARFVANGGVVMHEYPQLQQPALVVDGLLGIGLKREVTGAFAETIARINAARVPVLALDVPSGLDADTGRVRGVAVRATHTVTFLGAKPGLYTGEGLDHSGQVYIETLGIESPAVSGSLLEPETARPWLARRARHSHKGTFGTLGIVGGARGMVGAAILAARASLRAGAGKVYVGLLAPEAPAFDPGAPELMLRPVDDALTADVLVAGPGAGLSPTATTRSAFERSILPACIASAKPLVLDADALGAMALHEALAAAVAARKAPTILTPHPGEAARLLGKSVADVENDRIAVALALARRFNAEVVLKGAGSVCASPGGAWCINTTGNPGLASGGTGDALAGIIGALLCQGLDAPRALRYAVCAHGAAADACAAKGSGPIGLTASDVIEATSGILNEWTRKT